MMWYRFAQSIEEENNAESERQMLDMTGGVRSRKSPVAPTQQVQEVPPIVTQQEIVQEPNPEPEAVESEPIQKNEPISENNESDTFTDYTPPSSAEEESVEQAQDMYRAEDLSAIMDNAGVEYPMHESCRCRIQFRPDGSAGDLLIPRWEVSSSACPDCLHAQQMFNQYVEQAGVRVRPPDNANV